VSILLRQSSNQPGPDAYDHWLAVTGTAAALETDRKLPNLAERLEQAFVAERETWWRLGFELSSEPSAGVAHMPTAGSFGSDFGIMLAWSRLARELGEDETTITLMVCDDPWLFRHLQSFPGVDAGPAPALITQTVKLHLRGLAARCMAGLRAAQAALRLRHLRRGMGRGDAILLVYGHPASDADGNDAYFGDLMRRFPDVKRLLHTDCSISRAMELSADNRTASLHAWGSPLFAFVMMLCRWRPGGLHLSGPYGWLIRRSAALENSGGGPAMNRWQQHCQSRWLREAKPDRVLWPWENHGWERSLCRTARQQGVKTIGYQHTVIGPHQFNYAAATNWDGAASLPDRVIADGPAYRDEMAAWGMPSERLEIGGAFRFERFPEGLYDPQGPVFVPLSAISSAAEAQLEAARALSRRGRKVVVKPHPMYSVEFNEDDNLRRSDTPLAQQSELSAVLYTTGTSGLEAVLMGIPAYRLMLEDRISIDVLPAGIIALAVAKEDAADSIMNGAIEPDQVSWDSVLSDVDISVWERMLFGDINAAVSNSNQAKKAS